MSAKSARAPVSLEVVQQPQPAKADGHEKIDRGQGSPPALIPAPRCRRRTPRPKRTPARRPMEYADFRKFRRRRSQRPTSQAVPLKPNIEGNDEQESIRGGSYPPPCFAGVLPVREDKEFWTSFLALALFVLPNSEDPCEARRRVHLLIASGTNARAPMADRLGDPLGDFPEDLGIRAVWVCDHRRRPLIGFRANLKRQRECRRRTGLAGLPPPAARRRARRHGGASYRSDTGSRTYSRQCREWERPAA